MATFEFPTVQEINQRMQTDFKTLLPQSNPFLDVSAISAFLSSLSGRYFENYAALNQLFISLFLTTSTDDFLTLWGEVFALQRLTATKAIGSVTVTGTAGTQLLAGELLDGQNGIQYELTSSQTISLTLATISSLTSVGTTATAILNTPQPFATGISVTIGGAFETPYNGLFPITMTSNIEFTYDMASSPGVPATGIIIAAVDLATISTSSVNEGADTNAPSGTQLTFLAVIPGVDNGVAFVDFDGLLGGQDAESDDAYRDRILFRVQNPIAQFSKSAIEQEAFAVNGVTRVSVLPTTPGLGEVTIYFVRDNDPSIIPTPLEVLRVKNQILTIKPATITDLDVIVEAPTSIIIPFTFSSISPNTSTMQTAIIANLNEFFRALPLGENIEEVQYQSAIFNTTDPITGERLQTFALTTPTGTIPISNNEVALLGAVTYA